MSVIRLLLADDKNNTRLALRLLIDAQPDMRVVGHGSTAEETETLVNSLQPQVVVLALDLPTAAIESLVRNIRGSLAKPQVLILSDGEDTGAVRNILVAGAAAIIWRRSADAELPKAIRNSLGRGSIHDPTHQDKTTSDTVTSPGLATPPEEPRQPRLSSREYQVMQLVAEGYTNQAVADRLHISVKSVETYRARLMAKLGLKTRAEFVRYAVRHGLLNRLIDQDDDNDNNDDDTTSPGAPAPES